MACPTCGDPVPRQGMTYCSKRCSNRDPLRQRLRGPSRSRVCEICALPYKATYREQRTCSRPCGVELRRREYGWAGSKPPKPPVPATPRACDGCGAILGAVKRRRLCGDCAAEHKRIHWAKSNLARRNGATEHVCRCGTVIPLNRWKCTPCLAADRRVQRQRKKRAERARKRGVKREPYTLAEIAARDHYRCQIPGCGKQVAMTKAVPHLKAPTVDHVVPLHNGGDDTRANVQLAHFGCNARKHTGGTQQLALIG